MSHELTIREDGKVGHAYVGEVPWHGLGNRLEPGATIEEWKVAAGMDWEAKTSAVSYRVKGSWKSFPNRKVIYRGDTGEAFDVRRNSYQLVQPGEVLEFFRDLTDAAGFQLETAGTLYGGRVPWALARTNSDAIIADVHDQVRQYMLLSTSLDGSRATEATYVNERVVCRNTLAQAMSEGGRLAVRVTHRRRFDPQAVKKELGVEAAQSAFERTVKRMRELAALRVDPQTIVDATARLFRPDFATLDSDKQAKVLDSFPVQTVGRLALDGQAIGSGLEGVRGTAWGWVNAVTEYVDHHARTKGDNADDNRLSSAWFGNGADLKTRAFDMAPRLGSMQDLIDSLNHKKVLVD